MRNVYSPVKGLRWLYSGEENSKEQQESGGEKGSWCLKDNDTGLVLVQQAEVAWNMGFSWPITFSIHILRTNLCLSLSYLNQQCIGWCSKWKCQNIALYLSKCYRVLIIWASKKQLFGRVEKWRIYSSVCIEEIKSEVEKYASRLA